MQFTTRQSNTPSDPNQKPKSVLSAYTQSPNVEFSIDEFEYYALSRLNVLRWIEKQSVNGQPIDKKLNHILHKNKLDNRMHDEISHFISRLCFCQTTERRRWFLKTEKILFETRYKLSTNHSDKMKIHKELCGNAQYEIVTKEMILNNEDLNGMTPIPLFKRDVTIAGGMLPFYKVPFEEVITLIARRSVFLLDGFAFVPNNRFFSLITGKFRSHLNRGLVSAQKAIQKMKSDPITMECVSKVIHIIDGLHQITNGTSFKLKQNKGNISHKDVIKLSNIHFPLCMSNSTQHLKSEGHLKHGGRMHLGLFLKGIGLSLSEAIIYWRNSFTKIGADKFNKQYAYNVRHNYGKEGKRIDYTPYSCTKIIGCAPNNGDFHGCPFKIFDSQHLAQYLSMSKKMNTSDIHMVLNLAKDHHYNLACRHVFTVQHKEVLRRKNLKIDDIDSQWSHPNEYFDHSWKLYHGEAEKKEEQKNVDMQHDVEMGTVENSNNNNNNNDKENTNHNHPNRVNNGNRLVSNNTNNDKNCVPNGDASTQNTNNNVMDIDDKY